MRVGTSTVRTVSTSTLTGRRAYRNRPSPNGASVFLSIGSNVALCGEIAVRSPRGDLRGPSQREPDSPRDNLDSRVVVGAGRSPPGGRPPTLGRQLRPRLLRLPRRRQRRSADPEGGERAVRRVRRPDSARAGRRARVVGGGTEGAGVYPRERARRPPREVHPRARGGALPIARLGPHPR